MVTSSRLHGHVAKAAALCIVAILMLIFGGVLGPMIVVAAGAGAVTAVCASAPDRWRAERDRAAGY